MSINIVGFVKKLLPSFSKSDLEADMQASLDAIGVVLTTFHNLGEVNEGAGLSSKENKELVKNFYKELGNSSKMKVRLLNRDKIGKDIVTLFSNVQTNGEYLLREIDDALNDVIVSHALTAYKANIMRSPAHFYFMSKFALDMANYIYVNEALAAGLKVDGDYKLNKKQIEMVEKNLWIFVKLVNVYGDDPKHFKENLDRVGNITLSKDGAEEAVTAFNSDELDITSTVPNGFIGSPIYSIRLVFAQWEADRYRTLKDRKKLLELRKLHLEVLRSQGQSDLSIEKDINYLQKRITDIDYSLSKIEDGLNA